MSLLENNTKHECFNYVRMSKFDMTKSGTGVLFLFCLDLYGWKVNFFGGSLSCFRL